MYSSQDPGVYIQVRIPEYIFWSGYRGIYSGQVTGIFTNIYDILKNSMRDFYVLFKFKSKKLEFLFISRRSIYAELQDFVQLELRDPLRKAVRNKKDLIR